MTEIAPANEDTVSTDEFPPMKNDLIFRVIRGEQVEHAPVWAMRQAGRYLPEFRALRAVEQFFTVCRTPELACKVTLQPIDRFPLDASIIFCDILVIPQALGLTVEMVPGKGPHFPEPLLTPECLSRLNTSVDVDASLGYVYDAIRLTRTKLDGRVPLFGFCGAPWTIMAYCIEGGGSKTLSKAKAWLYRYPEASHELLALITRVSAVYLAGQVRSGGAQILQLFDSWAGELSPEHWRMFAMPYLIELARQTKRLLGAQHQVPIAVFPKGVSCRALGELSAAAGDAIDVVSIDWCTHPSDARAALGPTLTLQGNLDPAALYAPLPMLEQETAAMVARFKQAGGPWIANLGHGMLPDHSPDALACFVDAVHRYSALENNSH